MNFFRLLFAIVVRSPLHGALHLFTNRRGVRFPKNITEDRWSNVHQCWLVTSIHCECSKVLYTEK